MRRGRRWGRAVSKRRVLESSGKVERKNERTERSAFTSFCICAFDNPSDSSRCSTAFEVENDVVDIAR
jgi:hypothetical protein